MGGGKRFAVLLCAEDSDYVKKKYGGYFGIFVRMLSDPGETWNMFRIVAGEFPADDEIAAYDGFVITGSCNDAHSNDPWICKLLCLLQKLDSMKTKILGICFGHQILCRALGGKTGRNNSGWDIGITTLHISASSSKRFKIPPMLSVIEFHQDEVQELPENAEVMAWSEKTGVEMFMCGDHIMGIQGHPEYSADILLDIAERLLRRNLITDSHVDKAKVKLGACEPDRQVWHRLCTSFLKGQC